MPLSRSGDVPDFGAAFTALLHAAGLTPDKVLVRLKDRRVPISRSALYDWKKGDHLPEDDRPLLEVVKLCLDTARDRGVALGAVPGDRDGWIRLLAEAKQARDTRIGRALGAGGGRTGVASSGKPVGRWDPVELGVHRVIGGGLMPAYIERPHDQLLRAVLDPAVAASRLVVVRGPSSSGKSRAAYEAVAVRLADWRLDYPLDPGALVARLEAGIPARTVLWLGELRQYADADGGPKALGRLADLLQGEGNLVVTTMWHEHWNAYIDAARAGPGAADPAGTAGRLLMGLPQLTDPALVDPARGGVIDVPLEFTGAQIATAAVIGDPVLAEAAAAAADAGQEGRIAQYLAGVPDLLDRYAGLGGDPYGQAVITAAMDATRFGHASPLPATLVLDAAVGYLTDPQRTVSVARWRDPALVWAAAELNGAVRALRPVPPATGTGIVGYQVADYLDQHSHSARLDKIGPPSLWDALITYTAAVNDLTRLGHAAEDRGLYRHAAALWGKATAQGSVDGARCLVRLLHHVGSDEIVGAARLAATNASLNDLYEIYDLMWELRETGADDAVDILARRAAAGAALDDLPAVAAIVSALQDSGATDAVAELARRAADYARVDDPEAITDLLETLHEAGASEAVQSLIRRVADGTDPTSPKITALLGVLREAGANDAVRELTWRIVDATSVTDTMAAAAALSVLWEAEADYAAAVLAERAAASVNLDDPRAVAALLKVLRVTGADDAVSTLLARDPANQANLRYPPAVAALVTELSEAGDNRAVHTLARRATGGEVVYVQMYSELLVALREAGAFQAAETLAARATDSTLHPSEVAQLFETLPGTGADDTAHKAAIRTAATIDLDGPLSDMLLETLCEAEAWDEVRILAMRIANSVSLDEPQLLAGRLWTLNAIGARDAVQALGRRITENAVLDNPGDFAKVLKALHRAGAHDAVKALMARDPASYVSHANTLGVAFLLEALCEADADREGLFLLARGAATHANLEDPWAVAALLRELRKTEASGSVTMLLARDPARHASLDRPWAVTALLKELRQSAADGAVRTLARRAASGTDPNFLNDVVVGGHLEYCVELLEELRKTGIGEAVNTFAARAAEEVGVTNPRPLLKLLWELYEAGAEEAACTLATRVANGVDVSPYDRWDIAALLKTLGSIGASQAVTVLAERAANAGMFILFLESQPDQLATYRSGREPDGIPAYPWKWQEPTAGEPES